MKWYNKRKTNINIQNKTDVCEKCIYLVTHEYEKTIGNEIITQIALDCDLGLKEYLYVLACEKYIKKDTEDE